MDKLRFASPHFAPLTGTLRLVDGTARDAAASATVLDPPARSARSRQDERLFILLDLSQSAPPRLYRELRQIIARAYWTTEGSITAALRKAAMTANRHLFRFNLQASPPDRCYGGLTCVVLHGEDFFILIAGPCLACVLHLGHLECFPKNAQLPHLGMGRLVDIRLYHTFAAIGDTLLLASSTLRQASGDGGLTRVLPRSNVQGVLSGLEQLGAETNFTALVARLVLPSEAVQQVKPAPPPKVKEKRRPSIRAQISDRLSPGRTAKPSTPQKERPAQRPRIQITHREREITRPARSVEPSVSPPPTSRPQPRSKPARSGPDLGQQVKQGAQTLGRGVATVGSRMAQGAKTLFQRMLPGAEGQSRRQMRAQREPPQENTTVMMIVAAAILALVVIIVILARTTLGEQEQLNSLIQQAQGASQLAQTAGIEAEAREHWETALAKAEAAIKLQPDNAEATGLKTQAQSALDDLDGVVRLAPIEVGRKFDAGNNAGALPRQLVIYGQTAFVLDATEGWVYETPIHLSGNTEDQPPLPLVRSSDQLGGGSVGKLVDFTWIEAGGNRLSSGLVILEEEGALVTYDPAWSSEGGAPQLKRTLLGTPPSGTPKAVGSFDGRLYILDTAANQVWRYEPRGDTYPEQPDRYITDLALVSLQDAVDMAIDGSVYILHTDGTISKFLRGEQQPFEVRDVPGGFNQPVALTVDTANPSGVVYVADQGNQRVVVLEPDGAFRAQFVAEEAFEQLEALVVDEAAGRLYAFSQGRLHAASLPAAAPSDDP